MARSDGGVHRQTVWLSEDAPFDGFIALDGGATGVILDPGTRLLARWIVRSEGDG